MASNQPFQKFLKNPYIHRKPIKDPRYFYDRTGEAREILDHTAGGQCVSVVGPRRIGKTSLLFYLCNRAQVVEADGKTRYLYVFLDCEEESNADQTTIYQWIWNETLKSARELPVSEEILKKLPPGAKSPEEFEDAIGELCDAGFALTLLLDEFEAIAANQKLDASFFRRLRVLNMKYPVCYVTCTWKSLLDLRYSDDTVLDSRFFSSFHKQRLGLLAYEDARDLILKPVANLETSVFTEEDIDFLLDLAGCHPALLQKACYYLFNHKVMGQEQDEQVKNEVRRRFRENAIDYFRVAWEELSESEQKAMKLVCLAQADKVGVQLWNKFEHECLVCGRKVFSSAFEEFVCQQHIAGEQEKPKRSPLGRVAAVILSFVRSVTQPERSVTQPKEILPSLAPDPRSDQDTIRTIRKQLKTRFDHPVDLEELCEDVGLDMNKMRREPVSTFVFDLTQEARRRSKLPEVQDWIRKKSE